MEMVDVVGDGGHGRKGLGCRSWGSPRRRRGQRWWGCGWASATNGEEEEEEEEEKREEEKEKEKEKKKKKKRRVMDGER